MRRRPDGLGVRAALAAWDLDFVARVVAPFYAGAGWPLDPRHLARAEAIDAGLPVAAYGYEVGVPAIHRVRVEQDGTLTELGGRS